MLVLYVGRKFSYSVPGRLRDARKLLYSLQVHNNLVKAWLACKFLCSRDLNNSIESLIMHFEIGTCNWKKKITLYRETCTMFMFCKPSLPTTENNRGIWLSGSLTHSIEKTD